MQGKSNSFLQVSPFIPRSGILGSSYVAFPIDVIASPVSPYGCILVIPLEAFISTGLEGGPFSPLSKVYNVFNIGGADLEWSVSSDKDWVSFDVESGVIPKGGSASVTVTVDSDYLDSLSFSDSASISFISSNGCGDTSMAVNAVVSSDFPIQTMMFDQYDGPFEYPEWLPQVGYRYYLSESISGSNKWRYAPVGGSVGSRPCDTTTGPNPSYGTILKTYSGSVDYNVSDSSVIGSIDVTVQQVGTVTAYDRNANTTVTTSALSLASALAVSFPASQSYAQSGNDDEAITQTWYTRTEQLGWFPGSVGGMFDGIYCSGYSVSATTSDPVTVEELGIPIARTGGVGSAAQTQTAGDYNTDTRVNEGNFSRGVFTVEVSSSRENLTGIFVFLVTPTVGDPYRITVIKDYPILGASTVSGSVDFPLVPNSTVFMESWSYSYQKVVSETFESYNEDLQIIYLNPSMSWNDPITFDAPPPNECCWDDFEDYPDAPEALQDGIYIIITGQRFDGPGSFNATSYVEFYDDFENYATGETMLFAKGIGWSGSGSSNTALYGSCFDDFESYSVGSIFVFDFAGADNWWNGDGQSA